MGVSRRNTSPEDRERIVALYRSGMKWDDIAAETGWSTYTVSNVLKREGVTATRGQSATRTPPETEAQIIALYGQGVTWREIMEQTGVTEHTVSAVIKRNGAEIGRKKSLAPDDWERIVTLYQNGVDAPELGRQFGCDSSMIYYVLEHRGVERRQQVACDNPGYFDEIDTPDKAYWLGFIGADGCVTGFTGGYPRLVIKLARKDRDHLTILHKALKANRPIRDFEDMSLGELRPYSALTVYSPPLVAGLGRHGITPRKSSTLRPWDGPAHLMPHYWRGLVDGDGHIHINERGVFMGLAGSKFVTGTFAAWVNDLIGSHVNARPTQGQVWTVQVGGTVGILSLLRALYDDAPVALARKKALADLALHGKPLQATIF